MTASAQQVDNLDPKEAHKAKARQQRADADAAGRRQAGDDEERQRQEDEVPGSAAAARREVRRRGRLGPRRA